MEEYLKMLENMDEEMPSGINDSPHPSSPFGESTFPQGKAFEEAKPVVHAHWVTDFDFDPEEEQELYFYFCSKCKNELFGDKENFKYCPYCGAQMDESISCSHEDDNHDGEMPSGINDPPHPSSPFGESTFPQGKAFEEAKHRAEVFERMAFKLGEELDAAKKYIEKNIYVGSCGACLYKDEDSNGKHCKNCTGRNSHFIFSAEKAREEE